MLNCTEYATRKIQSVGNYRSNGLSFSTDIVQGKEKQKVGSYRYLKDKSNFLKNRQSILYYSGTYTWIIKP